MCESTIDMPSHHRQPVNSQYARQMIPQLGTTLIEIVISTGIVALVMTAAVAAISISLRTTTLAKSKVLATKYTQEGIEYFRAQRNLSGWESFVETLQVGNTTLPYCLASLPYTVHGGLEAVPRRACLPNENVDSKNIYKRQAQVTLTGSGNQQSVRVTVTVTWQDGGRIVTSTAVSELKKH